MAKKKKTRAPSVLDKAFALANGYSLANPAQAEAHRKEIRADAKTLMNSFCIQKPGEAIQDMSARHRLLDKIYAKEKLSVYSVLIRTIMLGYWDAHKVVYQVEPETVQFLDERFRVEQLGIPFFTLVEKACGEPIFIETKGIKDTIGFFCGITRIRSESFGAGAQYENEPTLVIFSIGTDDSRIFFSGCGFMSTREYFSEEDANCGQRELLALRLLAYIGYLLQMKDAEMDTLVRMAGKTYPYYQVFPIPYEDSLPDFSVPGGWVASGLCNYFGYLNRHTMVSEAEAALKRSSYDPQKPIKLSRSSIDDFVIEVVLSAALQWEKNKVVYQYNTETERKLADKYLDLLRLQHLPADLVAYMPYPALLLTQTDRGRSALITKCSVHIADEPSLRDALIVNQLSGTEIITSIFPCGADECYSTETIDPASDDMLSILCAMFHILQTFKTKAEKNAAKVLKQEPHATSTHSSVQPLLPQVTANSPGIRSGSDIGREEDSPVILFDLTDRKSVV